MAPRQKKTSNTQDGRFRIIGGRWRGRRFQFADNSRIRPTPDRVRETVFNWLQPLMPGARCLDLYAGSGALGMEALSRGAGHSVFVDTNAGALAVISKHLDLLECAHRTMVHSDALSYLEQTNDKFDLVFADPPFADDPWADVFRQLAERDLLREGGRVYLENLASKGPPLLPAGWELARSKRAGRVGYHLAMRAQPESK